MNTNNNTNKAKRVPDLEKIRKLPTANDMLDELYGKKGTPTREAFIKEAYEYYNRVNAEMDAKKKEKAERIRAKRKQKELVAE